MVKGVFGMIFAAGWVVAVFIGWWLGTSVNGWVGLGVMFFIMVIEGVIYDQLTKERKPKPEDDKKKKKKRRR